MRSTARPLPLAIALLLFCGLPALAQKGTTRPKLNAAHTLLWRISGNGLTKPSYIYGTMHVTDARVFDFSDSVLLKLQECEAFAMEIILDSAARQIFKEAFAPDTSSPDIRDFLSDEQEAELDAALHRSTGFSLEQLAHARPWLLSFFLSAGDADDEPSGESTPSRPLRLEGDRPVFLDAWLSRVARGEGKEIVGIESIDEQLTLFDGVPYGEQIRLMLGIGDTLPTEEHPEEPVRERKGDLGERMVRIYHSGDLEGLLTLMQSENTPAFYLQRLLTNRNHTMADRIAPRIATQSMFIAVGAGHLPGPEGVLELLRQKGFSVTPVRPVRTGLARGYKEKAFTTEWIRHEDPAGAIAIEIPGEPVAMPPRRGIDGARSHGSFLFDVTHGITYLISYFDLPAEQRTRNDDEMLKSFVDRLVGERTTLVSSKLYDATSRRFLLRTSSDRMINGRIVIRGERYYMLMAEGDWSLAGSPDIDRFLRSLTLLDYLPSTLRTVSSDTLQVEARLPSELALTIDTTRYPIDRVVTYGVAVDTASGYNYIIERNAFSRFYRTASPESLFDEAIESMLNSGDSVYKRTEMRQGEDPAVELEVVAAGWESIRRIRLVQHGDYLYRIFLQMPRDLAYSPRSDEFLSSVRPTSAREGDLFSSKLGRIVAAIEGPDSTLRKEATRVLRTMTLDATERQTIYQLLEHPRADDGAEEESFRYQLLYALSRNIDSTGIPALRAIYPTLDTLPIHRGSLRELLAEINTEESIRWLGDLLLAEKVIPVKPPYDLRESLYDVDSNLRFLFPRVLPLLDQPVYQRLFSYILDEALDSGYVDPSSIVPERGRILKMVTTSLAASPADSTGSMFWTGISGIGILGKLPADDATIAFLRSFADSTNRDIAFATAVALLHLRQPVAPAMLERLAAAPAFRLDLYRELDRLGMKELFPRRYLTQRAISEAALADWLEDEYDMAPDSIVSVAMREVTVDGERRHAYLFKILYKGDDSNSDGSDDEWTVGLGSLQPLEVESIDFTDEHARSNYTSIDAMTIGKHIDSLLEE